MINIDDFIKDITEKKLEILILSISKIYKLKYIKKGDYNYFFKYLKKEQIFIHCIANKENGRLLLEKLLNLFFIKNINIDDLFNFIKINGTRNLIRITDWETTYITLYCNTLQDEKIKCISAIFEYQNKFNYKYDNETWYIYFYENKIIWIEGLSSEQPIFIKYNELIYNINYSHKYLTIYNNLVDIYRNVLIEPIDDIIINYKKLNIIIDIKTVDISDYFYKGFFYKGLLFDRNWQGEISVIKNITFVKEHIKIEIENKTYPHSGFILLDVPNKKIIVYKN